MILLNAEKLHESLVRFKPLGLLEYVGRSPKDKLRALTTGAKAGIVQADWRPKIFHIVIVAAVGDWGASLPLPSAKLRNTGFVRLRNEEHEAITMLLGFRYPVRQEGNCNEEGMVYVHE